MPLEVKGPQLDFTPLISRKYLTPDKQATRLTGQAGQAKAKGARIKNKIERLICYLVES